MFGNKKDLPKREVKEIRISNRKLIEDENEENGDRNNKDNKDKGKNSPLAEKRSGEKTR